MRILYYYVLYCSSNRNYLMRFTTYYNWREFPFKKKLNLRSLHASTRNPTSQHLLTAFKVKQLIYTNPSRTLQFLNHAAGRRGTR